MTGTKSTRRRVLQGIGVGGTAAVLSGATIVSADEHEDEEEEDEEEEEMEEEEVEEEEIDEEAEFAALRCGHLSPDAPNVDVYVGKTPDLNPTVGSLSYPRFGPGPNDGYLQLPPGNYDLEIAPFGGTDAVIEVEDVELEAGVRYSALAVGLLDGEPGDDEDAEGVDGTALQPLLIADAEGDDEATPPEDEAEVSFVHASPDAGTVDVIVDDEPLLEDVDFGDVSDYFAVEPGEYEIVVESDGDPVLSVTRDLRAGTSVTGYVTGVANGEDPEENNNNDKNDNNDEEEEEEEVEESEEEEEDEEMEEVEDEEEEEVEDETVLPGLSIVTTLDGTNPLADGVVTR